MSRIIVSAILGVMFAIVIYDGDLIVAATGGLCAILLSAIFFLIRLGAGDRVFLASVICLLVAVIDRSFGPLSALSASVGSVWCSLYQLRK